MDNLGKGLQSLIPPKDDNARLSDVSGSAQPTKHERKNILYIEIENATLINHERILIKPGFRN